MNPDRTRQPAIHVPDGVALPSVRKVGTPCGIPLHVLTTPGFEVARVSLVFRAGVRFQNRPFQASAALNLMSEGTARYSSAEISGMIDFYGAYLDLNLDRDYAVITLSCLSKFLPTMLPLVEEVVCRPAFLSEELAVYTAKRKQQLRLEREKPSFRAREMFSEALYGQDHPYGCYFPEEEYDRLTPEALRAFHHQYYVAENCFAVASGELSDNDLSGIVHLLDAVPQGVQAGFPEIPPHPDFAPIRTTRPGSLQSAIRIGKLMFPRSHPDFTGMQVVTTLLGGYFGSRLVSNLREDKGYTYGVFSTMVNFESAGHLAVSTEVAAEHTDDAIAEIFREMVRLRDEPVGGDELDMVKNIITGEMMRILDGPFGIADVTIENIQNGTDNGYLDRFLAEVKTITPERVQALSRRYLSSDSFVQVIVG
ncbi:MAG: insulinase family protein [Rikenellaceae bacterium]|jgi:predicted Zn-dependent peptidase|nr:insulinase family protein [Rikenellaceae bacterium]